MHRIFDKFIVYKSGLEFCSTQVGKVSDNPSKVHFKGLVHLLRYIRDNKNLGLKYYVDLNDAPVTDLLIQANIKTKNHLMAFSDSSWQDCPDNGRITGAYIIFYQGVPIDHGTHIPGPVAQSSAESEYNAACTSGMALAHFRMLVHELLNEDPDMFPKEAPLIVLDSKSAMSMAKNGRDTKHTRHNARRIHFLRNGERFKMQKIEWCEGGLQLADIGTKNVSEPDITPRMKYIIVRLDN